MKLTRVARNEFKDLETGNTYQFDGITVPTEIVEEILNDKSKYRILVKVKDQKQGITHTILQPRFRDQPLIS